MNSIAVEGNLAETPTLRFLPDGTPVAELVVIENRRHKNAEGEWVDGTPNRFRVKAWRQLAENVTDSLATGHNVTVTGQIKTDRWTDKDTGEPRAVQWIDADTIGVSLRWQIARIKKADRTQPTNPASTPGDPWTAPADQ